MYIAASINGKPPTQVFVSNINEFWMARNVIVYGLSHVVVTVPNSRGFLWRLRRSPALPCSSVRWCFIFSFALLVIDGKEYLLICDTMMQLPQCLSDVPFSYTLRRGINYILYHTVYPVNLGTQKGNWMSQDTGKLHDLVGRAQTWVAPPRKITSL